MKVNSLIPSFVYKHPVWNGREQDIKDILTTMDAVVLNRALASILGVASKELPAFILQKSDLEVGCFPINLMQSIPLQMQAIVDKVKKRIGDELFEPKEETFSFYSPNKYQDELPYDADADFAADSQRISAEVIARIRHLVATGADNLIIEIFQKILNDSKRLSPSLHTKLLASSSSDEDVKLSRLVVDEKFSIWLPDYNNMQIEMTPLPKALYLLFLRHPEGIRFHDLVDHKQELLSIYGRITNSSSTHEIRKRIDELTDMRKNSVNEKCSRIREAFVSKMAERVAANYIVLGAKGEKKRIM